MENEKNILEKTQTHTEHHPIGEHPPPPGAGGHPTETAPLIAGPTSQMPAPSAPKDVEGLHSLFLFV